MADWYVDTCEDLGKELIKLGHKAFSDVLDITVWVDDRAVDIKKPREVGIQLKRIADSIEKTDNEIKEKLLDKVKQTLEVK